MHYAVLDGVDKIKSAIANNPAQGIKTEHEAMRHNETTETK